MLHSIDKFFIFLLTDRFRHRSCLKTFRLTLFFDTLFLNHFLQFLIANTIWIVCGKVILIKMQIFLLCIFRQVMIWFNAFYWFVIIRIWWAESCAFPLLYGIEAEPFDSEEKQKLILVYQLRCIACDVVDCVS